MEMTEVEEMARLSKEYGEKVETLLRGEKMEMKPYPPRTVKLYDGSQMTIYQPGRNEIEDVGNAIRPHIDRQGDYYDLVCTRTYAEFLGWKYYRYKNIWWLVGKCGDEIVGVANGRCLNDKIGISLHTIAFQGGTGAGAHLAAAKWDYFFEHLKMEEIWITSESPRGLNDILKWKPEILAGVQHELGGGTIFRVTKDKYPATLESRKKRLGW